MVYMEELADQTSKGFRDMKADVEEMVSPLWSIAFFSLGDHVFVLGFSWKIDKMKVKSIQLINQQLNDY